ncbi:hypothetical protein L226DRAFT_531634, partial [Lentinus tigrinus ALCF2SS1-7]|uniref:uncharacterized protein n=1 Tax=Lentinus tigrinus ALCF2SS1-7 TaxID=1328758 RepID=UPI00116636ED
MTDANFHIETPRLYISYFQPALDSHCDFLVRLYNTPEFIATCGRSPITTRAIARDRLATRFVADHARNGYGIYLVSLKPSDPGADAAPAAGSDSEAPVQLPAIQDTLARCKLIGTVSLMRGSDAVAYAVPDLGFVVLPEEMRKGYARRLACWTTFGARRALMSFWASRIPRMRARRACLGAWDSRTGGLGSLRCLGTSRGRFGSRLGPRRICLCI